MRSLAINSLGDIFAGTRKGLFFSNDNGDNWTARSNGIENEDVVTIFVTPEDSLLIGSFNGAYRSSDHGANWTQIIMFDPIRSFSRNTANVLFGGSSGGFVYRSLDNGLVWQTAANELTFASFLGLLFIPSGDLLAATINYGIVRSSDNGTTWSQPNTGLTGTDVLSMTETHPGTIFAVTDHCTFRTMGGGNT